MPLTSVSLEGLHFNADQIDCAVAVMLKILDGKCKMVPDEKIIMEELYDLIKTEKGKSLNDEHHHLILEARTLRDANNLHDEMRDKVYEYRLFAETMISRPVMKRFKASLREHGILPKKDKVPAHV